MGKDSLEYNFEEAESGLFSSTSNLEKKVKLFGIELNPSKKMEDLASSSCCNNNGGDHESVNSSTTVSFERSEPHIFVQNKKAKFECQYCSKEFGNSQALGGHQNAHKKERLEKKKMQLQATKASLCFYLHPFHNNNNNFIYDYSNSQICFDQNDAGFIRFDDDDDRSFLPEERRLFTLTQAAAAADSSAGDAGPVGFQFSNNSDSSFPVFKRNSSCKSLDLQLGLN